MRFESGRGDPGPDPDPDGAIKTRAQGGVASDGSPERRELSRTVHIGKLSKAFRGRRVNWSPEQGGNPSAATINIEEASLRNLTGRCLRPVFFSLSADRVKRPKS